MILEGYGIRLIRLCEEHIEMVRQHRNSEQIRQFMEYREHITSEMQLAWFKSIDTIENNYFVIEVDDKFIGLINGAQIDWDNRETGSGGIFIWELNYWETAVPVSASLLLTDTSVLFGLDRSYVKILAENKKAIAFNKQLGYVLMPDQESEVNQLYVLEQVRYLEAAAKLKLLISELKNDHMTVTVDNPDHPVSRFLVQRIISIPMEQRQNVTLRFL
jgi:UDP-4-amino-4,6-dideoxy-N-acetyl-beta-L-altrosamine N-acetyltransferase